MRITDTHVYFYNGTFSNWNRAQIIDHLNNVYANSEQAFMWYKAHFFGDELTADKILETTHPAEVKALGRQIRNFNAEAWSKVSYGIMLYVCTLKFRQNSEMAKELLETGDKILVEASPTDVIWGVGLAEDNDVILYEKSWRGTNLLGKVLMEVRKQLK